MAVLLDPGRSKLRVVLGLMQILRVLTSHQFLSALIARGTG